ncbi:uncharacterized protein LOC143032143 [Oratosquilla oratoria]|uniref:uncharacterized protein LOC143032143 n=1 Tax=Oratosquilla oratoria TaxID=337810 RepID=UPI003F7763D4
MAGSLMYSYSDYQRYPSLITDHFKQRLSTGRPSLESYRPTMSQIRALEEDTKSQAQTSLWFEHRIGRITASRVYDVVNWTPDILGKIMRKEENIDFLPSIQWGLVNETKAREIYKSQQRLKHTFFQCNDSGLLIDFEKPFLGASSDGEVHCYCCGKGLVEIKCPYKHRFSSIQEAILDPGFSLDYKLSLRKSHRYYAQVQLQMHVHKVTYCDFFVYTTRNTHCCRVQYDKTFCQQLVQKSEYFFRHEVLPAIQNKT